MMTGRFPWHKAVETDDGWHEFLTDEKYLRREFPISDQLDELLERCFRPVSATRPSLLQLRFEIANMKNLIKVVQPDPIDTQLLAVPLPNEPSAPPTPGASFSFNVSDYPSPATSNATSVSVDINPVRLSDIAAAYDHPKLTSPHQPPEDAAAPTSPALAELSPAVQEMLARLRARPPPLVWPADSNRTPKPSYTVPPKKPTRSPLKQLYEWIKQPRL
jgi:hypothetical protein